MSKIVEWFSSEGEMVRYRPLSARLPAFLAVYSPERGLSAGRSRYAVAGLDWPRSRRNR